ncbi:cytochrome P450 [Ceratobasidium sp. AG-I]|nr:cytochrome P450 [Ceratobasidium sp. AG-I]
MTHEALNKQASKNLWPMITKQSRLALQRILINPNNYPEELRRMVGSILLSSVYGYEVNSANDRLIEVIETAIRQSSQAVSPGSFVVNFIPWLQYVPAWFPGAGWKRKAQAWRADKDEMLCAPYNWTKTQMAAGTAPSSITKRLLTELANQEHVSDLEVEEDIIRWATGSMFAAGSDTSVASTWVFVLAMTLHQDVQAKAQAEIDSVLGGSRLPEMEDQESLPYVCNVLKELMRWRTVTPLGVPHASIKDDVYKGYYIPKGSIVIGNIW